MRTSPTKIRQLPDHSKTIDLTDLHDDQLQFSCGRKIVGRCGDLRFSGLKENIERNIEKRSIEKRASCYEHIALETSVSLQASKASLSSDPTNRSLHWPRSASRLSPPSTLYSHTLYDPIGWPSKPLAVQSHSSIAVLFDRSTPYHILAPDLLSDIAYHHPQQTPLPVDKHPGAEEDVMQRSFHIEDFEVNNNETDFSATVPKLKGQSNYRDWETALCLALGGSNPYYTHMVTNGIPTQTPPSYADTSPEAVRQMLIEEAQTTTEVDTTNITITRTQVRARAEELVETNEELCKEYHTKWGKWQACNSRAYIYLRKTLTIEASSLLFQITDVHEAFKKLRERYTAFSFPQMYARYTKWVDLRFKNGTASDFVRRFRKALRDLTAFGGSVTPLIELCQFKRVIAENARCHAFLQHLRVDENDPDFMDEVYLEFEQSLSHPYPSAND
ncbi:unnamed protein product [Penicillium palitans]